MFNEKNFTGLNPESKVDKRKEDFNDSEKEVFEMIKNSGFPELEEISENLDSFNEISSAPVPVEKIFEAHINVSISDEVKEIVETFADIINDKEGAKEYPFLLSGKLLFDGNENCLSIDKFDMLYESGLKLENNVVQPNENLTGKAIIDATKEGKDVFMLCHTHPVVSENNRKESFTEKMDPDRKKELKIRDVGLNLSVQDLYQLYEFERKLREQKETYNLPEKCIIALGVLMFNGEMYMVNIEDGVFQKKKIRTRETIEHERDK